MSNLKKLEKLIVVAALLCSNNFVAFSQTTASFTTVTEALNYTGNKATVKKIIITGTISGSDYSASSEWSKFHTLDSTFPNIEDVEILTSQDIPDGNWNWNGISALFCENYTGSNWIKSFSAPNTEHIGNYTFVSCSNLISVNIPLATTIGYSTFSGCSNLTTVNFPLVTNINGNFSGCSSLTTVNFPLVTNIGDTTFGGCSSLTSVNFPSVTTIGYGAFSYCSNLTTVNFPLATTIEGGAFSGCYNLVSVSFGTGFTQPTTIIFDGYFYVFNDTTNRNIDLTLGANVRPQPNLTNKTWQEGRHYNGSVFPYVWKSITVTSPNTTYTITATAGTNGTVSTNPSNLTNLANGTSVTLTATANSGYRFKDWTRKGTSTEISKNNPYTFNVSSNDSLVANFELIPNYTLTLYYTDYGTVTGGGTYASGTKAIIEATPADCHKFVCWTNLHDTLPLPYKQKDTITITKDDTLIARFKRMYYVSIVANPGGSIANAEHGFYSVHCGDSGTKVVIEAIPDSCYKFVRWISGWGTVSSTKQKDTITITKGDALMAYFEPIIYTVGVNASTGGTATKIPNTDTVHCGDTVAFTATANNGYIFVNWTDGEVEVSKSATYYSIISKDITLTANFEATALPTHTLRLYHTGYGTVTGEGTYISGTIATIEAAPATCYKFLYWENTNGTIISYNPKDTIAITKDDTLIARFEPMYYVLVWASTGGSIANAEHGYETVHCGDSGTTAAIEAIPDNCFRFLYWTNNWGILSYKQKDTITITKDDTLIAHFERITYHLGITASIGGSATKMPNNDTVHCGDTVTFTATANSGYEFSNWTENDNHISIVNPYTVTVTSNRTIKANFVVKEKEEEEFTVQLGGINPSNAGTVTGFGTYKLNDTAKLTAIADSGYKFLNWSSNNVVISEENPFVFVVTKDIVITVNFIENDDVIKDVIKTGTVSILPNPTSADFTISFDVIKPNNMKITLTDLSSREILDIYDGFVTDGLFTKIIKTSNIARGVYFVKILIDGNYITEKIILE